MGSTLGPWGRAVPASDGRHGPAAEAIERIRHGPFPNATKSPPNCDMSELRGENVGLDGGLRGDLEEVQEEGAVSVDPIRRASSYWPVLWSASIR